MQYIKEILVLEVVKEVEVTQFRCKSYPGKVTGFSLFGINFCKKVSSEWLFWDGLDTYTEEELKDIHHCLIDKEKKCVVQKPYIKFRYGNYDYARKYVFFDTYEEALQEAEKLATLFNLKKIDYDEYRK